ncbi:MAG: NUDIX hydrolase [Gammaproteobacteria bacterium]|nr:MAG: NUDIX hydrolase [Gammaproteobacteria bacterium]
MPTDTRNIYAGKVVNLAVDSLVLPNGERLQLEIVRHPGGAATVALNKREEVCLLRQYRHAAGGWLWELPAGKLEPQEPPASTAKRELEEEAGLQAADWIKLGQMYSTPGFCDEIIHLYLARELTEVPSHHGKHELIEVHWLPLTAAIAQVLEGTIRDAKTMLGLMLARSHTNS